MSENSVEAQKEPNWGDGFVTGVIVMFLVAVVFGGILVSVWEASVRAEAKDDGRIEGRNEARTLTACDQIAEAWPKTTGWNVGDNDCDHVGWEIFSGGKYVTMSQYKRTPRK